MTDKAAAMQMFASVSAIQQLVLSSCLVMSIWSTHHDVRTLLRKHSKNRTNDKTLKMYKTSLSHGATVVDGWDLFCFQTPQCSQIETFDTDEIKKKTICHCERRKWLNKDVEHNEVPYYDSLLREQCVCVVSLYFHGQFPLSSLFPPHVSNLLLSSLSLERKLDYSSELCAAWEATAELGPGPNCWDQAGKCHRRLALTYISHRIDWLRVWSLGYMTHRNAYEDSYIPSMAHIVNQWNQRPAAGWRRERWSTSPSWKTISINLLKRVV